MQNVDTQFMAKANNDFMVGDQTIATEVASVTTREIQNISAPSTDLYMRVDVPEAYRIDAKPFIERPFYVDQVEFPSTASRYSFLNNTVRFIPGDIARSNESLLNMFKMGAYGRPDLVLNISMAGTITHAGCILVGVLPPFPVFPVGNIRLINTLLTGPHAFLHANEATSVALPVPWYCNTDMATLDMQVAGYVPTLDITGINGNYATLVFMVLNPLKPSSGSSTSLNIIVEACFKHFDIVVPTPRFTTWLTQAGKAQSMQNPLYHDLDEVIVTLTACKEKIKDKRYNVSKIASIISAVSALAGLAVRLSSDCASSPEIAAAFVPESGLFSTLTGTITGLLDHTAGGLKTVAADAVDSLRSGIKSWTGLHNPNDPTVHTRVLHTDINYSNVVDMPQMFEKLDPNATFNRIVKEPVYGTSIDEMQIQHIVAKDQMIGSFTVDVTDGVGKFKWSRPISPFQGGIGTNEEQGVQVANNIELLHSMHRAWRGGLKIKIQSVMNNKQQVKLKLLKYYNPSTNVLSSYPSYASIANAPSHLLEFTQGGQVHEVSLPFLCRNDLCPCADNTELEALFHGMYYIYVAQPMANSDGSPTSIEFNVFIAGDTDLQFYGYAKTNTYHLNFNVIEKAVTGAVKDHLKIQYIDKKMYEDSFFVPISAKAAFDYVEHPDYTKAEWAADRKRLEEVGQQYNMTLDQVYAHSIRSRNMIIGVKHRTDYEAWKWQAQSTTVEVMNKPQAQQNNNRVQQDSPMEHFSRLAPNVDIRPLVRRMYKSAGSSLVIDAQGITNQVVDLASYLGEKPNDWNYTPIETISRMYYGKNVGFKIRLVLNLANQEDQYRFSYDINNIMVRVFYVPQNITYLTNSNTITSAIPNPAAFPAPGPSSPAGEIPFTYQLSARYVNTCTAIYEFVIPDTSFYKFMGSPNKFYNFDSNTPRPALSTADFGSFMIQLHNTNMSTKIPITLETFVGLTDETRFGFHSIAPPMMLYKSQAYYLGDGQSSDHPIANTLNNFVYRGRFL